MQNQYLETLSAKRLLSLVILALFFAATFTAMAQTKKRVPAKTPGVPIKKTGSETDPKFDLSGFVPLDQGKIMSAAYRSGTLPPAAAIPVGTVEEQAAALAEAVSRRDENSTSALIAALKAAGYGIRNEEGIVDYQRSGWQGMAIDSWQVAVMARSYGNGIGIGLGKFGDGLEIIVPEWKKETNAGDIVRSIRAAAQSGHGPLRFWACFIIELGRKSDAPYDLLNDAQVKHARLDAVQLSLIMTRLAADLNLAVKRQTALTPRAELILPGTSKAVDAAFPFERSAGRGPNTIHEMDTAMSEPSKTADDAKAPCSTNELENLILDLNATGMGLGFGQFTGYLESKGVISSKPGAIIGGANALLIALKLIATYAALDSEITMEGEQMLTRTKTSTDGERKTLRARAKIDLGRWQAMNCIRPALNAAGLDFSVPTNGALAGTRIDWNLIEGGVADSQLGNVLHTVKNLPSLLKDGTMDNGDAIVFLDTQQGVKNEDKRHYNYTDSNGESKIDAVGLRQTRNMSAEKLRPVMKRMSLNLDMQIKTMRLTDGTAVAGTANDLAGNAIAFFTKDIPGFIYGTTAETIYRSNLGSSKIVSFPVKDWMPCDGGWSGTITRTTKFRKDEPNVVNGARSSMGYKEWTEEVKLNVTGKQNEHDGILVNGWLAEGRLKYDETIYRRENDQKFQCTIRDSLRRSTTRYGKRDYYDKHENKADQEIYTTIYVAVYSDYAYLDFNIQGIEGDAFYDEKTETPCPEHDKHGTRKGQESWPFRKTTRGEMEFKVEYDPKNPGVLKGTRTYTNSDGSVSTLTWDLARCLA
jgi:hypothetical protein